jgi:disulfide oxidoreductase YuzD
MQELQGIQLRKIYKKPKLEYIDISKPSTKHQREYLTLILAHEKRICYSRILLISDRICGRHIKDVAELRFGEIKKVIEEVSNYRV